MNAPWMRLLAGTESGEGIVALANEFMERMEREDIVALPDACKPRRLASATDVNVYAVDLMRGTARDATSAETLQLVSAFFQEAAIRLATMAGPGPSVGDTIWQPPTSKSVL